ncbi:hypothetical protein HFN80_19515 [Rhizobium laguerreae]|uniref:hypothetical protein n=1 Tax=Rhizobium laguerreae TaxID=1076926 RepID=UPI001C903016|nr:hypothetical protein [Rhizobium laguerreae]MBY3466154.1 hypothetical protein [Rhizobium laguerreae]
MEGGIPHRRSRRLYGDFRSAKLENPGAIIEQFCSSLNVFCGSVKKPMTLLAFVPTGVDLPKFIILSAALMATIGAVPAFAGTDLKEDPSCAEVNYSYAATRSSWFYSAKLYDVRSDSSLKQIAEMRFDEDTAYFRDLRKQEWQRDKRTNWTLMDVDGPKLRSCVLVGEGTENGKKVKHYTATWHLDPYAAYADIWFWSEAKRAVRVKRHFMDETQANLKFGTTAGTIMEIFDYDPKTGLAPGGPYEP